MTTDEIKDYVVDYLLRSGFVAAYVKKLMFPSDIDNYYEDYLQEAWLSILEQKPQVWDKLCNSAQRKETDLEYEARNYFSRVIANTVRSRSSNAYRKLKGCVRNQEQQDSVRWDVLANTVADNKEITDYINDQG